MSDNTLTVLENGTPLTYSFADLMRYHGHGFPGGVTHGLKVMQRAFPLLSPDGPPERRDIRIETAFRGPGARDAFEMVTRCLTEGRYRVDASLEETHRGETLERYVFRLHYRGCTVDLHILDGHVRDEFIQLGRKTGRTADEEARLTWLKQEMADRLLVLPASEIYAVRSITPAG